ncbi:MAG: hypothetical protein H7X77_08305, partial [Anaerolineae bacterium]|nr:hypothetical protein [Anaerolineae bacterium]
PAGIASPDPILPGIALVLLLISIFPMRRAAKGVEQDEKAPVRGGLLAGVLLGTAYLAVNLFSYTSLGFNHQTQAFGSIFATMAAFQLLTTLGGVAMGAISLFWFIRGTGRGGERPNRHQSITDIALFWNYVSGAGIVTYLLLYVAPYLI